MQEWVIISGKGGTGKTSLTASIAVLAGQSVLCDCDVDAADLHLLLQPTVLQQTPFLSGREAEIDPALCIGCGVCDEVCRFEAVSKTPPTQGNAVYRIEPLACEGCGVCVRFCPVQAISFEPRHCGEVFVSDTRCGTMVHARMEIGAENSGKLVSTVRQEAQKIAREQGMSRIIVDGPPGIGCAVIASLTGATGVLVVTEPTLSGEHDLRRVLELTHHFSIPTAVCVNKWDVNPDQTKQIEAVALELGAALAGRVRYDGGVTHAQLEGKTPIETNSASAVDIRSVWDYLKGCH